MKDKPDYGMELESDTRPVSIQRYKLSDKGSINIFILNTGDIHASSKKHHHVVKFVKDMKNDHSGRVILLDAGDMLTKTHGLTPDDEKARDWRGKGQTERMFRWASSLPYDAMVFGNHDFIESASVTQQKMGKYSLPFICANLEHPDLSVPIYKIITRKTKLKDGTPVTVKIGVIGLADIGDDPNNLKKDYHFPDPQDKNKLKVHPVYNNYILSQIGIVENKADFIIFLSHNPDKVDENSIAKLPGKKHYIIVGGHSHREMAIKVNGRSLVKSGKHGSYVGSTMVEWDPDSGKGHTGLVKNVIERNYPMN